MIVPKLTPPMRIDWRSSQRNLPLGRVVDLDTMLPISEPNGMCCFVDEATGEWKRYAFRDGKAVIGPDGKILVECGKGRVKFFPFQGTTAEFEAYLLNYIRENNRTPSE